MLDSTTVPTAAHLCPSLPNVLLHGRTVALLLYFEVLFFQYYIQRIQHQFVFFRHTGRQLANFGSTTSYSVNCLSVCSTYSLLFHAIAVDNQISQHSPRPTPHAAWRVEGLGMPCGQLHTRRCMGPYVLPAGTARSR